MPVDALNVYNIEGYISYFNNRQNKRGEGTIILVNKYLVSRQLFAAVTTNDAFNVCAVAIGRGNKQLLVVAVYRAPWAASADTKELCKVLDSVVVKHVKVIIVGDFNLPTSSVNSTWIPKELNSFAEHHSMIQIAREVTREDALLDLVIITSHFADCAVNTLPPVGGSDHAAQLMQLRTTFKNKASTMRKVVDYTKLGHMLSKLDWLLCFNNCVNVDNYAAKFNDTFLRALSNCTHHKPIYKRRSLPKHVVQLLHIKKVSWQEAKRSGDYTKYKAARKTDRAAIWRHRRNVESRLIHNNDRKAFFSYINRKNKIQDS